jgi:hypothetical protein
VAVFLYEIASSRKKISYSGVIETISWFFNEELKMFCLLKVDVIKPKDLKFWNISWEIAMNSRYISQFKVTQM